jgi:hypothetical protein
LRVAEAAPSFRLFRRTAGGGEIDLTERHKKDLRDACDVYQHAIDLLKSKPIGSAHGPIPNLRRKATRLYRYIPPINATDSKVGIWR